MNLKNLAGLTLGFLLSIGQALAGSSPNLTYGQVLTPAQWNQLFINKEDELGYTPLNTGGGTMTGRLVTSAPSATTAGFNLTPGSTPSTPLDGDMWTTTTGLFVRINGSTIGPIGTAACPTCAVTNATNTFTAAQIISLNVTALPTAVSGTVLELASADATNTRLTLTAAGASTVITGRASLGTLASPLTVTSGTLLTSLNAIGYDGTSWATSGANGAFRIYAEGTWTNTSHPAEACMSTTPSASISIVDILCVHANGGVTVGALASQGNGTVNLAALYGNNTLIVDSAQNVTGTTLFATGNSIGFSSRSFLQSPTDGNLAMFNNAGTGFTSLKFGGVSASFPELKRNGTALNVRLADDSADAPITASAITLGANGGSAGQIIAAGSTSGNATITAQAAAGTPALLWPTASGTLTSSGTAPIVVNATTGAISCPTCNTTGANVSTVTNADGTLTISPTSGAVVASINLAHANTWTLGQTFSAAMTYGGVTLSNAVTGTGNMVLSIAPTITGHPTIEGVTSTGATGSGNLVFSAAPVLTGAPVLAAPSATSLIVGSSATLPASPAQVTITANTTTLPAPATGTILHVGGADSTTAAILVDAFNGQPSMVFRASLGSAASKSAVTTGSVMMNFGATGFGTTVYSASNRLQIVGKATENWTDTAQGTSIQFNTTPNGTVTAALSLFMDNSGGVSAGTTTSDGIGSIRANTSVNATTSYKLATKVAWSATAPTVNSGFCTSPSISANNGTAAFTITIGSACAASTGVLTMPTASVGWACHFNNVTTPARNTPYQTASTTTTVSVTNYARTTGTASNWTASEVVTAECTAY